MDSAVGVAADEFASEYSMGIAVVVGREYGVWRSAIDTKNPGS